MSATSEIPDVSDSRDAGEFKIPSKFESILKMSPPHQLGSALLSALLSGFEINYRISCKDFDSKIITLMSAIITKCIILVLILESISQAELTHCKMSRYEMAMEKGPRVWSEFVSPKFDIRYMQY